MNAHPISTRALTLLLSLSLTAAGWSAPVAVAAPASTEVTSYGVPDVDYVDGEVLVQYESPSQARVAAVNNKGAFTGEDRIGAAVGKAARLKVKAGTSVGGAIKSLKAQEGVVSAQPNYIYTVDEMAPSALSPNDPDFARGLQWGLHNDGVTLRSYGITATVDVDLSAKQAWEVTTGSRAVVVAVVDTGVDYTHPDLAANMWTNPGEIPGNGIDDDGSGSVGGYTGSWGIDDVYGADFYSNDGNPMDAHSHGTHVAGTIGAVGNNGIGVAGVAWNVQIMAVRFMGQDGRGSTFDGMLSIRYAAEEGADIINCSWGDVLDSATGESSSDVLLEQAIEDSGLLVVCAAGNGGTDGVGDNNDVTPFFPASRDTDNIISVGAHTPDDKVAKFSNYGKTSVDIFAPGTWIESTVPTWARDSNGVQYLYRMLNGTSMAAPHVAGVAALLLSQNGSLTPAELKEIILSSAVAPEGSPYANRCTSGGRLNAAAALGVYQSELGDLRGTARSSLNGAPIAGATVSVSGSLATTTTAADGSFLLLDVRAGSRTLTIDAPGYERFISTVSVTAWTTSYPFGSEGALLKLTTSTSAVATPFSFAGSAVVSGRITDALAGAAGSGGTVRVAASKDGGTTWVAVGDVPTGPDGTWSLTYNPSVAYETIHQVRATFLGTTEYGSSSAIAAVTPLTYLSTPTVSVSSPRARARFTVRGYIGPRFAPNVIPARAYFYKRQSNGTYALVKSIGLKTSHYSTAKTILSGTTSLVARGTYRARFMYGGTVKTYAGQLLGKTYGPWRYFTVR